MKIDSPVTCGLFCINKKAGYTSFETIRDIKKRSGIRKIGHTGTLDKFASGLLLVLVGGCTRLNPLFLVIDKEYRARICLGSETDTLDPEGTVLMKTGIPTLNEVSAVLPRFTGNIMQKPPLYSALHYHGERAYKIARRGESIDLPERQIRIHSISIADYEPPFLTIDVRCSGGTYIRSLARDIGRASGSCGYLVDLVRTSIGRFSLANSITTDEVNILENLMQPYVFCEYLDGCKMRTVKTEFTGIVGHGGNLRDEYLTEKTDTDTIYGLFDVHKAFLAVVRKDESGYRYVTVMNREDS
jgi:tRNA pseudouridine55 synthase